MSWTEKMVAERFEGCVKTLRKLPAVRMGGYVSAWPDIVYTSNEINRQEPKPIRFTALPDEITRMEETLNWIHWVKKLSVTSSGYVPIVSHGGLLPEKRASLGPLPSVIGRWLCAK